MNVKIKLLILGLMILSSCQNTKQLVNPDYQSSFQNPPFEARPRVWWHWMNGNVTKEGIKKDLEWMSRVGIRGVHNFDANLFTPVVVKDQLVFMTDEWKDTFKFATNLTDSLGLELTIAGSPGWSVTGGPWVDTQDGMKKFVWTETRIQGGKTFQGILKKPSDIAGDFQNIALMDGGFAGNFVGEKPTYYKDAMVIAYRLSESDQELSEMNPKITTSGGEFDLAMLTDGDFQTSKYLEPSEVGTEFWIQYEFDSPKTFKAMAVVGANHTASEQFSGGLENRRLLVSDDGIDFKEVTKIPGSIASQNTVAFAPQSAKIWRLAYVTQPPSFNPFGAILGGSTEAPKPEGVNLAEFVLYTTGRIDQFEDKAGFTPWKEDLPSFNEADTDIIAIGEVFNLTEKMTPDGTLKWEVPEGKWLVIRFGYGLTGRQNHPASPAGTGLEVDKLDEEAVRRYINGYLDMYKEATGGLMGTQGLQYLVLDSYEAGHMNWTHDFPQEFETRRGYNMTPWIPVLTGKVIESRDASEKFLWDFRKTIGEMITENHYDVIGEELKKREMGMYVESHEGNRAYLADGMDVKRNADVPMAAMWTPGSLAGQTEEEVRSEADIREAASVAHIYGKPYVAAESMTSIGRAFQEHPRLLKRTADLELASGLNRFVIHTSVHQPLDDMFPGFSLGPFGQYFSRHETWAEQSKSWIDYLSRSSYMLQQGKFVADVLVYYGENTNITRVYRDSLPKIPGYEYDFVNSTALIQAVTVIDKNMVTPGGGTYRVLVLDESVTEMTLPVLKKIKELVSAGVSVTGSKPKRTPTLGDDETEFKKLVDEIWSHPNVSNQPAASLLKTIGQNEDVLIGGNSSEIRYVHRTTPDKEIYWLNNRSANTNKAEISFRVSAKVPELWHPQTSTVMPVSWRIENGRTIIPLTFESWESYFIVFDQKTSEANFILPETTETTLQSISGPWKLKFQQNSNAPVEATFETLSSWTESNDPDIKYFSGTATYSKTFQLENSTNGSKILLDLGDVANIAQVIVNGKDMGILWTNPYKIDITEALKAGENSLEIQVTNLWVNRLIGDAQPDVKDKITFTTMPLVFPNQPLLPSGLLGEVNLIEVKQK